MIANITRIGPEQRTGLNIRPSKPHESVGGQRIRLDKVSSRSLGVVKNESLGALVRKYGIFAVVNAINAKIQPKIRRK